MSEPNNPHVVASNTGMADKIVLVGFMGTGKSTVSRLLAEQLGWRRIDSDEEIVRVTGKAIKDLFAEGGEAHFRNIESETLCAILQAGTPAVIATGGGAVLREENRSAMLSQSLVVALKADESHIVERVSSDTSRPLLQGDTAANVRRLLDERRTAYDFAPLIIDTTGLTPDAVCKIILEQRYQLHI
ncbi:shikimate kinase [Paenibacillus sp. MMS18-CY102]|uniref:shikimate kinase n=1 Tax=Paenibacillus sp. MMS18-CY102 TaxID=2682849 RepID=UPI00136578CA|nr:shikimate kinase [Paenibacillus sp. MMS18-CY102]MWC26769.1 AAA family ATPase [Paenibacillus sp. MMS18-CY102]